MTSDLWPALPYDEWKETLATVHMWTQIVGKIRLAQTPRVNHWWNVALAVTPRGLGTGAMRYGSGWFSIDFDFIDHRLVIACSDGTTRSLALRPLSVADFYAELRTTLAAMSIDVRIWPVPVEVESPIRFSEDTVHASYDPEYVTRFWKALLVVDEIFRRHRGEFIGKSSPSHFFWGSFDLAVTRFSGRRAPERDGADSITREAYSHEVISHGFWPGGNGIDASFYAYAAPEPEGFAHASIEPAAAYYSEAMKEYFLPYEAVRTSGDPAATLLAFMRTTYDAAADLARWDREALERTVLTTGHR